MSADIINQLYLADPAEWTAQYEVLRLPVGRRSGASGASEELVYVALGDPWAAPDVWATPNFGVHGSGDGRAELVQQLTLRLAAAHHSDAVEIVTIDFSDDASAFGELGGIATRQFTPRADVASQAQLREWISNQTSSRTQLLDWHGETTHREVIRRLGIAMMPYLVVAVAGAAEQSRCDLRELLELMAVGRSLGVVTIVSVDPFSDRDGQLGIYPTLREYLMHGLYLPAGDGLVESELPYGEPSPELDTPGSVIYTPPPLLLPQAVDIALVSRDKLAAVADRVRARRYGSIESSAA